MALFQGQKVRVVGRVDRGGDAENRVCDGDSPSQLGIVLDVVDHERCVVEITNDRLNGI